MGITVTSLLPGSSDCATAQSTGGSFRIPVEEKILSITHSKVPVEFKIGFEALEGYAPGPAKLGDGWLKEATTSVFIDSNEKSGGSHSLRIEAGDAEGGVLYAGRRIPGGGIRFIDLQIRPAELPKNLAQSTLSAWGSSLGMIKNDDGNLEIVANAGALGQGWMGASLAVLPEGEAAKWVHLTFRQDEKSRMWDLFVNGRLTRTGLPLDLQGLDEFLVYDQESAPVWLDDLEVSEDNPLFKDTDRDGMPDAEESALGYNEFIDDRLGDLDGDGVSNIDEYLASNSSGTSGRQTGEGIIVYVDNQNGSDGNNGLRSYVAAGSGPKASIKAAMSTAENGDMIVILPGRGVYDEGSRGAPGKRLTIKALSNVTIR